MAINIWLITILLIQVCSYVDSKGLFSISSPGTIRLDSNYTVAVSIFNSDEPCIVKVGLIGPNLNVSKTMEVKPNSTKTTHFTIPKYLEPGDYNLTAEGLSGIKFKNSTSLDLNENTFAIYLQTDKPQYLPGDKIQYRILFVDPYLRPYKNDDIKIEVFNDNSSQLYEVISNNINVNIFDAAQNRIKQYNYIEISNGMFIGELQLPEFPVIGYWHIEVGVNKSLKKSKYFKVVKYALPKFEVIIKAAKNIEIKNPIILGEIQARYTYGKPVKGKAIVLVKPTNVYFSKRYEKTFPIDGRANIECDISMFFDGKFNIEEVDVIVTVEEELTGVQQKSAIKSINTLKEKFIISDYFSPFFVPGDPFLYKILGKNLDESPIQDTKNSIIIEAIPFRSRAPAKKNYYFESKFDKNGVATFEMALPRDRTPYYSIKAKYLNNDLDWNGKVRKLIPRPPKPCSLDVLTENLTVDKEVSLNISSFWPLDVFFYEVTARGNIILTETVHAIGNPYFYEFKIQPTFAMVPRAVVLVYLVRNNTLCHKEALLNFDSQFQNHIEIEMQSEAKPGEDIKIHIKTDPESYVGLLGVDQSVLLLNADNNFKKSDVFSDLYTFDTRKPYNYEVEKTPGDLSGVTFITNAEIRNEITSGIFLSGKYPKYDNIPLLRKDFFEVWIWDVLKIQGNNETFTKKVPDTITSWVITGFSLNPKTGLALTEEATKLRVFQPFFASTNLPYSVKRGEVISIPIIVFNYLDKNVDAKVTLDNKDKEFEFTEATNEVEEKEIDEIERSKIVMIPANSGKTVSFMIRPNIVGQVTLNVKAESQLAGDALQQPLRVEPEGMTEYVNKASLINLKDDGEYSQTVDVAISPDTVPNSTYVEVSVVGDLLGPTIKNLKDLVRMPYGCGEQNMINFVPNILVLKYLTSIGKLRPDIEEEAKEFLVIGYQQELTYKHDDGSYSAFGKRDKSGSTWLTAYVARSFHQAAKFTEIDPKVLDEALTFLAGTQSESGKFVEVGKVIDHQHSGDSESGVGLTAFVLLAFLENVEAIPKFQDNINKGLKYVAENIDTTTDLYSLSVSAFALQLTKNEKTTKLLEKLNSLAKTDGDQKWWSKTQEEPRNNSLSKPLPISNNIEITSYIIQALLINQSSEIPLSTVKWLISQRNSNGGFASTQDTVVGMQALIKFAEKVGAGGNVAMNIEIEDDQGTKNTIKVNNENSLVLQTHVLPTTTKSVKLNAKGRGSCLVQVSYRYNVAKSEDKPRFIVKPTVLDSGKSEKLVLQICTSFVPDENEKESNMAVMEVSLPSGYTADSESFDALKENESVKRVETKKDDSVVIVYYDNLGEKENCGKVEAIKTHAVAKQKPTPVVVYDYYDNLKRGSEYYSINSSLCDICQEEDCAEGCNKKKSNT